MEVHEDNLANLRVASFSYYLKPGEENFVQKINSYVDSSPLPAVLSQEPPYPISSGTRTKSSTHFFSQAINSQDSLPNHHLVPSFSPGLNSEQENIVFKVKAPIQDLNASTHVDRTSSCSNGEIGVFGADKYFNMRLYDGTNMKNGIENERIVEVPGLTSNLRPGTASISSEASSWNSKAALLRNLSPKASQTRPRKATRRRIFASLGCSGPCLEKEVVSVAEIRRQDSGIMPNGGSSRRLDHFAFPVPNGSESSQIVTIKKPPLVDHAKVYEMSRKSLEVFGSGRMKNGDVALNLAKKLSVLTWDAIPKSAHASTTTLGSTTICDDMTSDASSDLFEIEDISGNGFSLLSTAEEAAAYNYHGNVVVGCMSPPIEYAPSEASIEWSVVTASAADFSSIISDYDEKNVISGDIILTNSSHRNSKTKHLEGRELQKGRPGGLLGCKSQKAVNVAESVVSKTKVVERY